MGAIATDHALYREHTGARSPHEVRRPETAVPCPRKQRELTRPFVTCLLYSTFTFSAIFGTVCAPVYTGFIDQSLGWRWIEWIHMIFVSSSASTMRSFPPFLPRSTTLK